MSQGWALSVLGSVVRLERRDETVVPERRSAALLALLALEGPMPRERAAAMLWPDRDGKGARANLRQLLYRLRASADAIEGGATLSIRSDVVVDAHPWMARRQTAESQLSPGASSSILDAYDYDDLPEVAERLVAIRERVRQAVRSTLTDMAAAHEAKGDLSSALAVAEQLATYDPVDEAAAQHVMRLRLKLNDSAGAVAAFARLRQAMARILEMPPSEETAELAARAATLAASRPGGPASERARLLVDLAWIEHRLGRHDAARSAAEAGLALLGTDLQEGPRTDALFVLGSLARYEGDLERAAELWRQAIGRAASREGAATSLTLRLNLGMVEDALGRTGAALEHYLAALPLAQSAGDAHSEVILMNNIGMLLIADGRYDEARPLLLRAAQMAEQRGDRSSRSYVLETLASCELARGEPERARGLAAQALAEARALQDPGLQVEAAATFAEAEAGLGNPTGAVVTVRAALALAHRHANRPGSTRCLHVLAKLSGPSEPLVTAMLAAQESDSDLGQLVDAVLARRSEGHEP